MESNQSTQEFVRDLHEQQQRSEKSQRKSGNENNSHKLASKQHSTNK